MTQIRIGKRKKRAFPPGWKIRRELRRLWQQGSIPLSLAKHWITRPVYDMLKGKNIILRDGNVALGQDIAIFLMYAPKGVLPSHIHTLNHLKEKGFSSLIVANHELTDNMLLDLGPYAWRIMQRPNFGYDFGGYREGILHLSDEGIVPDNLLVMNDSIWFPLREKDDLLDRMRGWRENIRGFARDHHKRSRQQPFVQSYIFMYDKSIIKDPSFLVYWRSIMLTNNKHLVIRKLEMGMSPHFEARGFSVRVQYEYNRIGEILGALPIDRQIRFLEIEAQHLKGEAAPSIARLKRGEVLSLEEWTTIGEWSQVDGHILKLPPELLFDVFDVNMLKKLKQGHFVEQRKMIMANGYQDAFHPAVREELSSWDGLVKVTPLETGEGSE